MIFKNNKVYDALKWLCLVFLPALVTLYYGLSKVWPLPYAEEVVATWAVVETFLGAILGIGNIRYKKENEIFESENIGNG